MIACANPLAEYLLLKQNIDAAIMEVCAAGIYIHGNNVKTFEQAFADYIGCRHGIGVGNGTDALHLALRALEVGPGDEVITVSHTAVATVAAIAMAGAIPVLVDIEPAFYTIDPQAVREAITPKTKAVIAVHLYGQPADLTALQNLCKENGLRLIEDCAQAHGAEWQGRRVGSFGDAACFSFYPTKNLAALGDGGMVLTSDDTVANKVRLLHEYGWKDRYVSECAGFNSRLDEIQAAILNVKLGYLDAFIEKRRRIAGLYHEALGHLPLERPLERAGAKHAYHLYVIAANNRDGLKRSLAERGVGTGIHYPVPVHLQPAYSYLGKSILPVTEKAVGQILSLPMHLGLTEDCVDQVIAALRA